MHWHSAMAQALPLVATLLALGCAPPLGMRPMTRPLPGHTVEMGAGFAAVGPRPVGQDDWGYATQGWVTAPRGSMVDVSLVGAFDGAHGTAGLGFRVQTIRTQHIGVGLGVEVGTGWVAAELPIALTLRDRYTVYTAPQLGTWGIDQTVRVPLGVDVRVVDALSMRGEAQLNYPDYDPYKRRLHLGLGVAWAL